MGGETGMKRIFLLIVGLLIASPVLSADWYVRDEGGEYGAEDGTSYAAAYDGAGDISWASIACGDTLYICGEQFTRQTANHISVGKDCTIGSPLTISFDCPNDPGSINAISNFPAWDTPATWTNHSGNVWYLSTAAWGATTEIPLRVWLSGVEYPHAETVADADVSEITSTYRWHKNAVEQKVYVYATENPATAYTAIAGLQQINYPIYISEKSYIDFINPKIYGGRSTGIMIYKSDHIRIIGNGDTSIVTKGGRSIDIMGATGVESSYNEIKYMNLDSGFSYYIPFVYDTWDAIAIRAGHHNEIAHNIIKNWPHNAILVQTSDTSLTIGNSNNDIYLNDISSPDLSYGRAITFDGMDSDGAGGFTQNNKFRLNYVHDMQVRNQINGNNNEFTNNLITHIRNSPVVGYVTGQGVHMQIYGAYDVCKNNTIANNTFIDIDGAAVYFVDDAEIRTGHQVTNNIMFETGLSAEIANTAIYVPDQPNISSLAFLNNDIYSAGHTDTVNYRGSAITVTAFNASDANGDTITDNISDHPKVLSNGKLKANSPCIDVGYNTDGIYFSNGKDIGAFETSVNSGLPRHIVGPFGRKYNPGIMGGGILH